MQEIDQNEIEKTIYLASLVSDPVVVDPLLDEIRFITARGADTLLTTSERATISKTQEQLKEYLVTKERVGSFTKESLQQKLTKHFSRTYKDTERMLRRQLAAVLILPFLIATIVFLTLSFEQDLQLVSAIPALLASQYIGLLWFFWSGRKALVTALQKSLSLILTALVILVAGGIIFVLLAFLPDIAGQPIFLYSGPLPVYIFGFYLLYLGADVYAKQVGISKSTRSYINPITVTIATLVLYFAIWLLPHNSHVSYEVFFDISVTSFGAGAFLCAVASVLIFSAARQVTKRYAGGLRYLAAAFATMTVSNVGIAAAAFTGGTAPVGSTAIIPVYIVGGIGYAIAFGLLYASAYTLKLRLVD
jgi:hypothetical protein